MQSTQNKMPPESLFFPKEFLRATAFDMADRMPEAQMAKQREKIGNISRYSPTPSALNTLLKNIP